MAETAHRLLDEDKGTTNGDGEARIVQEYCGTLIDSSNFHIRNSL